MRPLGEFGQLMKLDSIRDPFAARTWVRQALLAIAFARSVHSGLAGEPEKPLSAPTEDRVGFPRGYEKDFQILRVVPKEKERKVVTVYGNKLAASVTNSTQLPYPMGSILVMETASMTPAQGEGGSRKENVLGLHVMKRGEDFGKAYGENKAGDWEFVEYRKDGSYITTPQTSATCSACHVKAGIQRDFVFRGQLPETLQK